MLQEWYYISLFTRDSWKNNWCYMVEYNCLTTAHLFISRCISELEFSTVGKLSAHNNAGQPARSFMWTLIEENFLQTAGGTKVMLKKEALEAPTVLCVCEKIASIYLNLRQNPLLNPQYTKRHFSLRSEAANTFVSQCLIFWAIFLRKIN